MRNQRGITLVALVITIIVLLILAGVSIAMLTGDNGILTKATSAKEQSSQAEVKEAVGMVINEIRAELYSPNANVAKDGTNVAYSAIKNLFITRYGDNMKIEDVTTTAPNYVFKVYYGVANSGTPGTSTVSYTVTVSASTLTVTSAVKN
ncbi:hypothetical protein D3C72_1208730 [compost metagenome]